MQILESFRPTISRKEKKVRGGKTMTVIIYWQKQYFGMTCISISMIETQVKQTNNFTYHSIKLLALIYFGEENEVRGGKKKMAVIIRWRKQ